MVVARNVDIRTQCGTHAAAAGRRACATDSRRVRHACSDNTGATANGRAAERRSRRPHRQATCSDARDGRRHSDHGAAVPKLFDERRQLAMRSGGRPGIARADRPLYTSQVPG